MCEFRILRGEGRECQKSAQFVLFDPATQERKCACVWHAELALQAGVDVQVTRC